MDGLFICVRIKFQYLNIFITNFLLLKYFFEGSGVRRGVIDTNIKLNDGFVIWPLAQLYDLVKDNRFKFGFAKGFAVAQARIEGH